MAFELGMVALLALLPNESWLFAKVFNFMQFSHLPFIWLLSVVEPESVVGGILALLLVVTAMALVNAEAIPGQAMAVLEMVAEAGRQV
jgi:hypothetical protein